MEILGVKVTVISKAELLDWLNKRIELSGRNHIVTSNPEFIVEAQSNNDFKQVLNSADVSLADGIGILIAKRFLDTFPQTKRSIVSTLKALISLFFCWRFVVSQQCRLSTSEGVLERITGVDLVWMWIQQDWMKGRKVYLLGGENNVAAQTMRRLQQVNPDVVFRSSNGHKSIVNTVQKSVAGLSGELLQENQYIIEDINLFKPDILLIAYGHPWQDMWLHLYSSQLRYQVAVGVGGTFDYISQRVVRAPLWMRNLGLEWLYRFVKQPKRYKRILAATYQFTSLLLKERLTE